MDNEKHKLPPSQAAAALAMATSISQKSQGVNPAQQQGQQPQQAQPQQPKQDPIVSEIEELKNSGVSKAKIKQAMAKIVDESFDVKT